jgi:death-on-curing protein
MRYLTLIEVLVLHDRIIATSGGSPGIRDFPALESALAQPMATFDGDELYPDLVAKAAICLLCHLSSVHCHLTLKRL